jgi:dTDP-4-dehydrorhamnose 3,5-epimerase-like enzyme
MKRSKVSDCRKIDLPRISDSRGHLSFLEGSNHIPFEIKRIFYSYGIPEGRGRGAHAHKDLLQFMICLHGRYLLKVDDGFNKMEFEMNSPSQGVLVPNGIWADQIEFSKDALSLVVASAVYQEADYIRNYEEFLKYSRG